MLINNFLRFEVVSSNVSVMSGNKKNCEIRFEQYTCHRSD
jgi:hypothetical protein